MGKQQHVVAVPLPSQGHLNSLMRFCKLLAQQQGFLVTFVDIEFVNNRADQEVSAGNVNAAVANASHEPLIRRAHIPVHGLDHNDSSFSFPARFHASSSIAPYLHQLILSLNRDGPPVTCLLSDFTMTSPTQDVADQLGIPRIVLFPFCASWFLLLHYVGQGEHASLEGVREALSTSATRREVVCKGLRGLPTLFSNDLPHFRHLQEEDDSLFVWNLNLEWWQTCNSRAHSIVINSCEELESSTFMALASATHVPIYGVGPWIETLHKEYATSFLWKEDEECITWLDQQPPSSVLYVSFGSIAVLSQVQFEEILSGLLMSEQRFLWAFRPGLVVDGTISSFPTHIMSKSHGKGFAVDWAPQLKVLSHPSVGGFLTHCGWNSVVESIAHGVPMLCCPYFGDQPLNARCIVDEWKVGLDFEANDEIRSSIKSKEIERAIRSLMEGVKGELVRQNVTKLMEACLECLSQHGSSYKSLEALVGSLM